MICEWSAARVGAEAGPPLRAATLIEPSGWGAGCGGGHPARLHRCPTVAGPPGRSATLTAMLVAHTVTHATALHDQLAAINILKTVKDAVLGFLVLVLLIGVLIGFLIGRAFGRRR